MNWGMGTVRNYVEENKDILQFMSLFLLFMGIFYAVYSALVPANTLNEYTAREFGFILGLFGFDVQINSIDIVANGFALRIIEECTSLYSIIVFTGCVLAYPTTFRKKVYGIGLGIPGLYGINLVRLVVLFYVMITYPDFFDLVHLYVWQITLILLIVIMLIVWLDKVVKK